MRDETMLKPCPFCGGEVSLAVTGYKNTQAFMITRGHSQTKHNCKCKLWMESEPYFLNCLDSKAAEQRAKAELITAWNRRANDENA